MKYRIRIALVAFFFGFAAAWFLSLVIHDLKSCNANTKIEYPHGRFVSI